MELEIDGEALATPPGAAIGMLERVVSDVR
jgi:hypothetical protein